MQNMSTVRDDFHKERRVGLFKQFIETQQIRRTESAAFTSPQESVDSLPIRHRKCVVKLKELWDKTTCNSDNVT